MFILVCEVINVKQEQYFKNLTVPEGKIDIILDTDTYNEIDDQFAISYMLLNQDKFSINPSIGDLIT